jgi:hypothetical protein
MALSITSDVEVHLPIKWWYIVESPSGELFLDIIKFKSTDTAPLLAQRLRSVYYDGISKFRIWFDRCILFHKPVIMKVELSPVNSSAVFIKIHVIMMTDLT